MAPSTLPTLACILCLLSVHVGALEVGVSSSEGLLHALMDQEVQVVKIEGDFSLERQHWPKGSHDHSHLIIARNLTLTSDKPFGGLAKIDTGFMGDRVAIGAGHVLQISHLHFVRSGDYSEPRSRAEVLESGGSMMLPFFVAEHGHLIVEEIIAEVIEGEEWERDLGSISDTDQRSLNEGKEVCEKKGVQCPVGAIVINGDMTWPESHGHLSYVSITDSLQVMLPTSSHKMDTEPLDALVDDSLSLQAALWDPRVRWIFLEDDVIMDVESWSDVQEDTRTPFVLSHKVMIISHPWLRPAADNPALLDLNFRAREIIVMEGGALEIQGVTMLNAGYADTQSLVDLGYFKVVPGGSLILRDVVVEMATSVANLDSTINLGRSFESGEHILPTDCEDVQHLGVRKCDVAFFVEGNGKQVGKELSVLESSGPGENAALTKFDRTVLAFGRKESRVHIRNNVVENGEVVVNSESGIYRALENPDVSVIQLAQNIEMSEEVWGTEDDPALILRRAVTITSHSKSSAVALEFGGLQKRVRIQFGAVLKLLHLDLGALDIAIDDPHVNLPFIYVERGGLLRTVNVLGFFKVPPGPRIQTGEVTPPEGTKGDIKIVSSTTCRELISLACPENAIHFIRWSLNEDVLNKTKKQVVVSNMLIVGMRATEMNYKISDKKSAESKSRVWIYAALGLAVVTVVTLGGMALGLAHVARKKKRLRQFPTKQRKNPVFEHEGPGTMSSMRNIPTYSTPPAPQLYVIGGTQPYV